MIVGDAPINVSSPRLEGGDELTEVDPAFERAKLRIPSFLRDLHGARFVPICNSQKKPAEGVSARWAEVNGKNYAVDDPTILGFLAAGHNYGAVCGFAELAVPDIEDIARIEELSIKIPQEWPTVKTGRATGMGRHFYIRCPDLTGKIILYDPVLKDQDGEPLHLGEIQSHGCQVVGPGSIHPSGNRYELVHDHDGSIPVVTKARLLEIFKPLIIEDSTIDDAATPNVGLKRQSRNYRGSSVGDSIPIDAVSYPSKVVEHHGAEIVGSHPIHGSKSGKNFSINTHKNTWHCFRCDSGGDPLVWFAVEAGYIRCQDAKRGCCDDKELFKGVLQIAKNRGIYIPEIRAKAKAEDVPHDLVARVKADPNEINKPRILDALADLKLTDPIGFGILFESLQLPRTAKTEAKKLIDKMAAEAEAEDETSKLSEVSPDIKQAANEIIEHGEAYEYIYQVWQKRVKGNQWLGKALLISRGVQSCRNTKGIHVYAHGKHGQGKSEGMEKMAELVPSEFMMDEDVSPLAIHYASEEGWLQTATTLFIDEMLWTDSLAAICKKCMTKFQHGASHLTVIDGKPKRCRTKERMAIWTNSADIQTDEQLRDRVLDVPVDETQTKEIIEFQKTRDTLPDALGDYDRETVVCQEILRDLASKSFTVQIPFAQRIKFPTSEGTRGYNIFSDLIKGLAALRYTLRSTNEKGQLMANENDYSHAKELYEGIAGHSEARYTPAETRVLQAIIDNGFTALIADIRKRTGLSEGRIKDIINGRGKDEQKRHGLLYKCPHLEANRVNITIQVNVGERRTTYPLEYSLPNSFRLANSNRQLITLDTSVRDVDRDVVFDVHNNNNNRENDVYDVVKEEREDNSILDTFGDSRQIKKSLSRPETASNASNCQQITKADTTTIRHDLQPIWHDARASEQTIGPNPRKDQPTPLIYHCPMKQFQVLARTEYGISGQVDPAKLLHSLKQDIPADKKSFEDTDFSLDLVCKGLEFLKYDRIEGDAVRYRQVIKLPEKVEA